MKKVAEIRNRKNELTADLEKLERKYLNGYPYSEYRQERELLKAQLEILEWLTEK